MKHHYLVIAPNHDDAATFVTATREKGHTDVTYDSVDLNSDTMNADVDSDTSLVIILAQNISGYPLEQQREIAIKINSVLALRALKNAGVCIYYNETGSNLDFLNQLKAHTGNILELASEKELASHIARHRENAELNTIKAIVNANLSKYISSFKLAMFGHHHDSRAQQILNAVGRAKTTIEIDQCLQSQLNLFQHYTSHPTGDVPFSADTTFAANLALNPNLLTHLKNIPHVDNGQIKSGYLDGISASLAEIKELRNPKKVTLSRTV
jgi:hypothetical protein